MALLLLAVLASWQLRSRIDERFVGTWSFQSQHPSQGGLRLLVLGLDGSISAYDEAESIDERDPSYSDGSWFIEGDSFVVHYKSGRPLDRLFARSVDFLRQMVGKAGAPVERYQILSITDNVIRMQLTPNTPAQFPELLLTRVNDETDGKSPPTENLHPGQ